jgi:branched-chain amino acid transport system permease protein
LGINLNLIWQVTWAVSAVAGLVAGMAWGSRQGVSFSLSMVMLKALPVLILGGFTSIGGVIVAGVLVGAGEALAEAYVGPLIGGGIGSWFAYVIALVFLLFRPTGLFGDAEIERV